MKFYEMIQQFTYIICYYFIVYKEDHTVRPYFLVRNAFCVTSFHVTPRKCENHVVLSKIHA